MKLKSVIATGTALVIGVSTLKAQDSLKFIDRLSVGVNLGTVLTYTDIKQYDFGVATTYHNEIGFGAGVNAMYSLNSIFGLQGQFNYASYSGTNRLSTGTSSKTHKTAHNSWFEGNLIEPTLNLNVNLTNLLFNPNHQSRKWNVYGYVGAGICSFRTIQYKLVKGDDTDPVLTYEGYNSKKLNKVARTNEVVMPMGLGLKYRLNPNFCITAEVSGRYLYSDKLDAFQGGTANDAYQYSSLGAVYNFSSKINQPESDKVVEDLTKMNELIDGFGDKDGDAVADRYDKDQNTPAGVKVYADGTSVDSDGDGVADYLDKERFSNAGAKVDENGVEADADGDKVADSKDLEPNTAKGAQVDVSGVTIKTGGSTVVNNGTPTGLPSVYFAVNASTLDYKSYDALTTVARAMKANKALKLIVVGHADSQGNAEYNKKLAQKRAEAVASYLSKVYGIDKSRLTAESKGSSDPLTTEKNSIADRRVDFLSK